MASIVAPECSTDRLHPLRKRRTRTRAFYSLREEAFNVELGSVRSLPRYGVEFRGKRAVVVGWSNVVGMLAALLLHRGNATISIVHSYTKKPEEITRQADIVISAAGVANLVTGSWIKPGAVIINVGINPVDDPECPRGYRPVMSVTKRPAW